MSEEKMQAEQEHCHCEGKCSHEGHHHSHDHEEHSHSHEGHSHAHGDHHHGDHHHTEVIHTGHEFDHIDKKTEQRIYILEGLGCANCAAKMERQICALPEVEMAVLTYATKQLKVAANHQEALLPKLQEICSSIESEVTVVPKEEESLFPK